MTRTIRPNVDDVKRCQRGKLIAAQKRAQREQRHQRSKP